MSDIPRCKTCKHWTRPSDTAGRFIDEMCKPIDQDTYEPMNRGFEARVCQQPTQTFCETPVERDGFGLADGSDYTATLVTAEDFGCVRHES